MLQKIKKFLSLLFRKQALLFLFIFLILSGFLFLSQPVQAQQTWEERGTIWGAIKWVSGIEAAGVALSWASSVAKGMAFWIFNLLFTILGTITVAFAGLAVSILNYVLSPNFISLSYTQRTNPIIDAGLSVTQGFVNMILVLVLIYIALATILRLAGYETKKLLVTFVIVALLVNFAPVLCGLIVDATNIVMNYFTKNISTFLSFSNRLATLWTDFLNAPPWAETKKLAQMFGQSLVITIFGAFAGLIFLLFAIVFMVRYVAIWVLVILSPLAFVCYILPATKKFWNLWWNQFIQWSIIGITMGFFLYLGAITFSKVGTIFKQTGFGEVETPINILFAYFVPLAFLYLGFIIGLSTSAMGASTVIGLTKKYGKKGGGWIAAKAGAGVWRKVEEKGKIREKVGVITKKWEEAPYIRAFVPEKMRKYAEMRPAIDKSMEGLKPYGDPEVAHRAAVGDIYGEKAAAGLLLNVTRGNSNDWFQQHMIQFGIDPKDEDAVEKLHNNEKYRAKMARLLQIAKSGGYHNEILRGSPRLAEFAIDAGFDGYKDFASLPRKEARIAAKKRVFEEIRPQHINNWEEQDVADKENIEELMYRGEDVWQAVSRVKRGHMRPLEIMANTYKTDFLKPGVSEEEAWKNFEKSYREQGKNGFFDYLASGRGTRQGWTKGKIIEVATGKALEPTKPTTAGQEVGIKVVTPIGAKKRTEEEIERYKKMREEPEKKKKESPPEPSAGI